MRLKCGAGVIFETISWYRELVTLRKAGPRTIDRLTSWPDYRTSRRQLSVHDLLALEFLDKLHRAGEILPFGRGRYVLTARGAAWLALPPRLRAKAKQFGWDPETLLEQ